MFQKLASRDHSATFSAVILGVEFPDLKSTYSGPSWPPIAFEVPGAIRRRYVAAATCQRLAVGITGLRRCPMPPGWLGCCRG